MIKTAEVLEPSLLISIGVPVRNGGRFLEEALDLLVNQTYKNIEIIISDNNSDDNTAEIITRFKEKDPRIKVFTQTKTLTASENFLFVMKKATGSLFMWAAYDDRRSLDHIEGLVKTYIDHPESSLIFSDTTVFSDHNFWKNNEAMPHPFECGIEDEPYSRLKKYIAFNNLQIYGLMNKDLLSKYHWPELDNGPDISIIIYLSMLGDFIRSEKGKFYYYKPFLQKTMKEKALANSLKEMRPFPELRLCWQSAIAATTGARLSGKSLSLLPVFSFLYFYRHWRWIKPTLFNLSPQFAIDIYRKYKYRKTD